MAADVISEVDQTAIKAALDEIDFDRKRVDNDRQERVRDQRRQMMQ